MHNVHIACLAGNGLEVIFIFFLMLLCILQIFYNLEITFIIYHYLMRIYCWFCYPYPSGKESETSISCHSDYFLGLFHLSAHCGFSIFILFSFCPAQDFILEVNQQCLQDGSVLSSSLREG